MGKSYLFSSVQYPAPEYPGGECILEKKEYKLFSFQREILSP